MASILLAYNHHNDWKLVVKVNNKHIASIFSPNILYRGKK